jgi:epoxyqueuosine reductase
MNTIEATAIVKNYAYELGFDVAGITSAEPFDKAREEALSRLQNGMLDGLPWFHKSRIIRGSNPEEILPGAKSIISVAMSYRPDSNQIEPISQENALIGKIASYSWGKDYHKVIEKRLKKFADGLSSRLERKIKSKIYVDTGPMQDRAVAYRSGVGWYGKNTNIITLTHGSWVFLGQIITDLRLLSDQPLKKNCGTCMICIEKCPTGALVAPYVLDNTKCISYLTIELKGPIPIELRPLMGDWVFGCDICQDVCPVNRKAQSTREPSFTPGEHGFTSLELIPLLQITDEEFLNKFQGTPIMRAKKVGLLRNVCIALGNLGDTDSVPYLSLALSHHASLVSEHAAWALGQIGGDASKESLTNALESECRTTVIKEIEMALAKIELLVEMPSTLDI